MTFDDYISSMLKSSLREIIEAHRSDTLPMLMSIATAIFELFPLDEQVTVMAAMMGMLHGTVEGSTESQLSQLLGRQATQGDRLRIFMATYTVAFNELLLAKADPTYPHPKRPSAQVLSLVRPPHGNDDIGA